jgi:hypothetical protein
MTIRTDPDVIRKHAKVPRSYREVHGDFFYTDDEQRLYPSEGVWVVVLVVAWLVVAIPSVLPS